MPPEETKNISGLTKEIRTLAGKITDYMRTNDVANEKMSGMLKGIGDDLSKLEVLVANNYVRREEFSPVQKIVYGMVAVILMAVLGALVALVVVHK